MNTLARRLRSIGIVTVLFVSTTVLLPLLFVLALSWDAGRALFRRRPFMATRALAFGWIYLASEVAGIVAMFLIWLAAGFGRSQRILLGGTYAVQRWWTATLISAVETIFSLTFDVEGTEAPAGGPIIVLVRHSSLVDTLLPGRYVTGAHGLRLRYVLKKELLADPCLDIAGNRLPNYFVDRGGGERELDHIKALADGLGERDGLLIFPEGTRFTPERRRRALQRLESSQSELLEGARSLRQVLPPRPAGTLALLDAAAGADVVILAHHGLEVLSHIRLAWHGDLVGRTISVRMWRVPAAEIPRDRRGRLEWLFAQWQQVDDWLDAREPA